MLTKFETKSNRVKGLSFHPHRPWILASLHTGVIQLWDYRMGTLLDRFEEHEGPVRGVDFHKSQPLFVSAGDDSKVKVWNYKLRRCLFTLTGHLDYIRTAQFHDENPWILTASDDQTIRIWNWQSRTCVLVLTGHNHYVMCAAFHPKEDLVMSASLDQTVRVWDISGLRSKNLSPNDGPRLAPVQSDIFGSTDAVVKWVLEGHDRGVNWASFHPSLPLFVSGADDKHVKLWRHNDTKAWEVDTFRGHFNNVSCVLFHPRQDLFISNSEDKSIRVWDIQKRTCLHTFRRENDRFWVLAAHPEMNLFAAGHDNGMMVFKLERERPGMCVHGNTLYFVKDRYIRTYEFSTGRDVPVIPVRRTGSTTKPPRSMSYNPAENAVILTWDSDGGTYELYQMPKDPSSRTEGDCKRGLGRAAVFVARNRFAVLDTAHKVIVRNLKNEQTTQFRTPHPTTDCIFYAGTGCVLLRSEEKMTLFDIQRKTVVNEVTVPRIKHVYWSADMSHVALMSKHAIVICNRKLEQLSSVLHETIRLKSGAWDDNGVFIYTTLNHIKYCLPNGDSGVIRTLAVPVYITKVVGSTVHALDREIKTRLIAIDSTEYTFKQALIQRNYTEVLRIIKSNRLVGKSIVSYLQKKGFPEVALHFVKDEEVRFSLALECGNISIARECAVALDKPDCWHRLGVEALRQGNHQVVEMAYQRTKNYQKLSFLYLITGNTVKLRKMLQIANMRNDAMARFHNSLYLGDVTERVNLLANAGQVQLAYVTARTHGLDELADQLAEALGGEVEDVKEGSVLFPPTAILRHEANWPLLTRSKGYFDDGPPQAGDIADDDDEVEIGGDWMSDDGLPEVEGGRGGADGEAGGGDEEEGSGWGSEDSMDLPDMPDPAATAAAAGDDKYFVAPTPGPSTFQSWSASSLVVDHVAAGSMETAMQMLHRQIGAVKFDALKPRFTSIFLAARATVPCTTGVRSLQVGMRRKWDQPATKNLPVHHVTLSHLVTVLQKGYEATTLGKFSTATNLFLEVLHSVPLLAVDSSEEVADATEMVTICREYITGLRLVTAQKECSDNPGRTLELSAYFTHCNLETKHLKFSLGKAMSKAFKLKNFQHAASFARRLLDLGPKADVAERARKVLQISDENRTNAVEINYDERNPFVIDCLNLRPIFKGSPMSRCAYCMAAYEPDVKGTVCVICNIAQVGAEGGGLQLRRE